MWPGKQTTESLQRRLGADSMAGSSGDLARRCLTCELRPEICLRNTKYSIFANDKTIFASISSLVSSLGKFYSADKWIRMNRAPTTKPVPSDWRNEVRQETTALGPDLYRCFALSNGDNILGETYRKHENKYLRGVPISTSIPGMKIAA